MCARQNSSQQTRRESLLVAAEKAGFSNIGKGEKTRQDIIAARLIPKDERIKDKNRGERPTGRGSVKDLHVSKH